MGMLMLLLVGCRASQAAAPAATFSSVTLVGERWDNGEWGELDAHGHMVGPPLKRTDPKAQLIASPRESPDLLVLSETTVICTANDSVFASTDAGRSWTRAEGHEHTLGSGYVPSPEWLRQNESAIRSRFMEVQPVRAYVEGCYPDPINCSEVTTVTADPAKPYVDWGLSASGDTPKAFHTVGRKAPNVWRGLPKGVTMMCTSCGGGAQLADGSFVYLAVVQYGPIWQTQPVVDKSKRAPCCNNSVVSFVSIDGLDWEFTATVGLYDEQRIYQEGPNECDVVLLKDNNTL